ncbi:MAG: YrzE family protein [Janthinobacterium lividum]
MSDTTYRTPSGPGAASAAAGFPSRGRPMRRRISWGAILGGVVLVVVVQLLLSLLGTGIGLSTVDVNAGSTPDASSFGIGAGVWWLVSSIVALFVGGLVAARMAGIAPRLDGLLHGLVTWGIATLLTIYLLTSAVGGLIGGGFSALGGLASAAGSGISSAAKPLAQAAGVTPDAVKDQAEGYLQPSNPDPATMSPQDAQKEVAKDLATYAKGGPDAAGAKERVVSIMAAQLKVSHDDAAKKFDDAQAKLQQAKAQAVQTAKNAADASASAASKTSFAVFVDLLLGGIAAAVGGALGVQRRVPGRRLD